jgi:hypothetical protein
MGEASADSSPDFSVIDPELCLPDPNNLCDGACATTAMVSGGPDAGPAVGFLAVVAPGVG